MARKKFLVIFVIFIGLISIGYHVFKVTNSTRTLSDLAMANLEALSASETGGSCTVSVPCSSHPNDYVSCTGSRNCMRSSKGKYVICDGNKTSCN